MDSSILEKIPKSPGVYLWKKGKKVLYVGKAKNLKSRLASYFKTDIGWWKQDMVSKADDIDFFVVSNEEEALLLENRLIKKYQPPYNALLKGDTGYVYIRIGEGDYPKIEFTRYKDKPGIYIGPKPWKKDLKQIFQILRRILKFRTCSDTKFKQGKLCSDYMMGLCKGRCLCLRSEEEQKRSEEFEIGKEKKKLERKINFQNNLDFSRKEKSEKGLENREKEEYEKIIKLIKDYFEGNDKEIKNLIKEKINEAVKQENFEYAALLRDIYFKLDKFINKQAIELNSDFTGYFIKIREYNNLYFMSYVKFVNGKLVDIVKFVNDENNFLKDMLNEGLIKKYVKLKDGFYFGLVC